MNIKTQKPVLAKKTLTLADLDRVRGGQRPNDVKSKVCDSGGYCAEFEG